MGRALPKATKAISSIIATVLMLMIVIALGGTAYFFVSGTFSGKTAESFTIIDVYNDTIIISNAGTETISSITATMDGSPAPIAVTPNIGGLVGYWSFNDGAGLIATDTSGSANHGVITGAEWVDGKYGKALEFVNTEGDWVQIVGDVGVSGEMTLVFWFNTPVYSTNQYLLDNRNPGSWWFLKNYTSGSCREYDHNLCFENRVVGQDSDWTINRWTHMAITDDTTTSNMYIDGVLIDTGSGETTTISTNLRFGTRFTNSGYYTGMLDEISVYNRALSPGEIQQLYSGLLDSGQSGTIKFLTPLSAGKYNIRLCTRSMCTTGSLTII
jgi:flagellin-like protein